MKGIQNIAIISLLAACVANQPDYSKEFIDYFRNSEIELRSDSLIFPMESGIEPILIPSILDLGKEYEFKDRSGRTLIVQRTNYTDIIFEIREGNGRTRGQASLSPTFYLGSESVGTAEGEFWVVRYYVTDSDSECFFSIDVGNRNIAMEQSIDLYAHLNLLDSCAIDTIMDSPELMRLSQK